MRKVLHLCLLLLILILIPKKAAAENRVIILSLPRVDLRQLAEDQSLSQWLQWGAVGLLNTGTAASPIGRHLYVTMGAGSRALGTDSGRLAFMQDEDYNGTPAKEVYQRHQGRQPEGEIVHLGIAEIIRVNQTLQHSVQPGLLGDTLHANGKKTAIIGNSDGNHFNREASVFIADSSGQIDFGDVSRDMLMPDESFPYGWRMNKERVWETFRNVYPQADLILIDWGDTLRLDEYRSLLKENLARQIQQDINQDISWFISQLFEDMDSSDMLLLLAGVPPVGKSGADTLGFLSVMGDSYIPGKLLTSATTRRSGLAAVTDIAPLVLEQLEIPIPAEVIGRSVTSAENGDAAELLSMRDSIGRIYRLRPMLLKTYVVFQIIFVLGALLNLFVRFIPVRRFEGLLMSLLVVPLLLLYLPLDAMNQASAVILTVVTVIAATLVLQSFLKEPAARFAAVALITSVSLVVDILRHAQLMKVSVLGYDPVSGARYYGLGNEYMGVLVGTAILGAAATVTLWPRLRRLLLVCTALFFILILLLLITPGGGANLGGTITALAAFIVTLAVLLQLKPGWKSGAAVLTVMAAAALAAFLLNYFVPPDAQSHLGRTLVLLQDKGWQALQDVVVRKGAMNLKLFRYSQWSRVFLVFLGVLAVLFYRPRSVLRDVHKIYPALAAGFLGIIAGSITALLVNDSGVVAAATTLLYAGVPIIILSSRVVEQTSVSDDLHK